jgi:hypothetical protein
MLMYVFLDRRSGISMASPSWLLLGLCCAAIGPVLYGLWYLLRPVTLIANRFGFTLTGGFLPSSEVQPWKDVDHFLAISAAKRLRVACALKPDAPRYFRAKDGQFDGSAILAGFYPADPDRVAGELNSLRHRALGDTAEGPPAESSPDGMISDQPVRSIATEPETIRSARWIYAAAFTMIVVPGALVIWANIRIGLLDRSHSSLLAVLLTPVMLGSLWFALHPPVLTLDSTGFTVTGGFVRSPITTRWQDVKEFLVYDPPKSFFPKIAYEPSADRVSKSPFSKAVLGFFYVRNADDAVNRLNDYRRRALGIAN